MRALTIVGGAAGAWMLLAGLTAPDTARSSSSRWRTILDSRGAAGPGAVGLAAASLGLGVVGFVVTVAVTGLLPAALSLGLVVGTLPSMLRSSSERRRAELLREAWPDALGSIVAGLRAGMALPECCSALAEREPEPLRAGFGSFARTYRASGSFLAGLQRLREELEDAITDRVTVVLGMAHEVGGSDLVRILRATSDLVRDELRTRGEVRARWSWTVNAARVAGAAPVAVLILMSLRPEARVAYASSSGTAVIVAGFLITLIAYRLMLRAARLPEERRLR